MLSLKASFELMKFYGIPITPFYYATNKEEAEIIKENLHFPVVIKIDSQKIIHKTDMEAVKICYSQDTFEKDFEKLFSLGKIYDSDGILVQEFVKGYECIAGVKIDDQFGPVILFGSGGILTEALNDVSVRLIPISKKDAEEMIDETNVSKILNFRTNNIDKEHVIDVLLKISALAEKESIKELDINPLFVNNSGVFAADVRIMLNL